MRKFASLATFLLGLFLFSAQSFAQNAGTVSGTVLADDDGSPLVGVTVTNTANKKRTTTNSAGYFSIEGKTGETLSFVYVGYVAKEVRIADSRIFSVRLVASDKDLGNVVVTGYGQARNKRELAYQAPVVKGEDVAQTKRDNFLNGLAGRVPGLTVTSTSGLPGASAQVVLRGGVSIGGNNQPLFVVDGVPLDNSSINQESLIAASNPNATGFANRNGDYTNRIADINPEDIENITVLKGPEATSIYGSDGAAGAIVITTKKGASGRSRMTYDNSFSFTNVYRYPEIQQVYSRGSQGISNPAAYGSYGFSFFGPKYDAKTPMYDNIRNFFQQGTTQTHNFSVEGGTPDATFRLSAGLFNQKGVVPTTDYKRTNIRLSGSARLGKKINVSSTWSYMGTENNKPTKGAGSFYTNLMVWPMDQDINDYQNPDGTRKTVRGLADFSAEIDNPYWEVYKNRGFDKNDRVTGNINMNIPVTKWLTVAAIGGLDFYGTEGYYYNHPQSRWGYATKGFLSTYTQNFKGINGTLRATVRKSFLKNFENTFTAGMYGEDNKRNINSQKGERFYEPNFVSMNNTDPTSRDAKLASDQVRKVRFFASNTLGYKNQLYLSLSGTREGVSTFTSKFLDKQPFFNYGSVSSSWIFSDLPALKSQKWLSFGKLRASYATTGKAPLVPYIVDYSFTPSAYTGGGFSFGFFGNNFDLTPEFSKNFEVGGEVKFFKNRLGIDIAYFNNKVDNQIISNRLSYGTGFVLKWINGGSLSAKGMEVQITGNPIKSKNFNWDITVNYDKSRTNVEKMPADLPLYYDSDTWLFGNARSQVTTGVSLANISGYTFRRNTNGDLLISPTTGLPVRDLTFQNIGDRNPDFKVGIINNFTLFQDLTLSFNLDIRKGGDVFNANEMMLMIQGLSMKTLDREQPRVIKGVLQDGLENSANPTPNTISITPYLRNDYYSSGITEADFIESVNWLRLRDATVAYRIPQSLIKRQKLIKAASVFVTGTDLFIITNYSGIDPNVNGLNAATARGFGGAGIDYGSIPAPRTVNFGVKVQF